MDPVRRRRWERAAESGDWAKPYDFPRLAEGHVEASEDILAAEQVEPNTKPWREPNSGCQSNGADADWKMANIDRNQTPIADNRVDQLASFNQKAKPVSFSNCEDRGRSPGVHVHPHRH